MSKKRSSVNGVQPAKTHDEDPIIGVCEVGRQIGKDHSTVSRWCRDGLIAAVRLPGGRWGLRQSQINKFLEASDIPYRVSSCQPTNDV